MQYGRMADKPPEILLDLSSCLSSVLGQLSVLVFLLIANAPSALLSVLTLLVGLAPVTMLGSFLNSFVPQC